MSKGTKPFILLSFIFSVLTLTGCATANHIKPGEKASKVVINKEDRRLYLYDHGQMMASYPIDLGRSPYGPKLREGDYKTPEGNYHITFHNPHSHYTEALGVSYPNTKDRANAAKLGVKPGGSIEIHGYPKGVYWDNILKGQDWTDGCIALNNHDIKQVAAAVPNGTPVTIEG